MFSHSQDCKLESVSNLLNTQTRLRLKKDTCLVISMTALMIALLRCHFTKTFRALLNLTLTLLKMGTMTARIGTLCRVAIITMNQRMSAILFAQSMNIFITSTSRTYKPTTVDFLHVEQ